MSENIKKAYSEVDTILNFLNKNLIYKIPTVLLKFFKENKDNNYNVKINPNQSLESQTLLPETIDILALLKLNYWLEDENEKQKLLKIFKENDSLKS